TNTGKNITFKIFAFLHRLGHKPTFAFPFDYFVSTQQKRGWHRRFDLSGITMGLPARADLVLRFGLEIAGIMALVQLFFRRPAGAVDHSPALNGRASADFF